MAYGAQLAFNRSANVVDPTRGAQQALSNVGDIYRTYLADEQAKERLGLQKAQAETQKEQFAKNYALKEEEAARQQELLGIRQDELAGKQSKDAQHAFVGEALGRIAAEPTFSGREKILAEYTASDIGGFNPSDAQATRLESLMTRPTPKEPTGVIPLYNPETKAYGSFPRDHASNLLASGWQYGKLPAEKGTGTSKDKSGGASLVTEDPKVAKELLDASSSALTPSSWDKEQYSKNKDYLDNLQQLVGKEFIQSNWKTLLTDPTVGRSKIDEDIFDTLGKNQKVFVSSGPSGEDKTLTTMKDAFQAMTLRDPQGNQKYNVSRGYNSKTGKTEITLLRNPQYSLSPEEEAKMLAPQTGKRENLPEPFGVATTRSLVDRILER